MNMRTVALRAGVSSATVSRVINGSSLVKEETAEHVRRVIAELKFIPNPVATTLKYGWSRTYGLIIPDITNPFYSDFLQDFEGALVEIDHELLLANLGADNSAMVRSIRRMLMRQVDGVVMMASEFETKAIEPLLTHKVPLVTVDRRRAEQGVSDVAVDFEGGFFQAACHLRELGHKRVAFVGGIRGLRTSTSRLNAFRTALERCGLRFYDNLVREGNYRVDGGEAAVADMLAHKQSFTAVMTANDLTAFGVIRGLHKAHVSVPDEVSVIGMDDVSMSDVLQPALTTVRISRSEMAGACLQALEYTKEHLDQRGIRMSVKCTLVVRESTTRPRARLSKRG